MLVFSLGYFIKGCKVISNTTISVVILSFLFTNIAIFLVIYQYICVYIYFIQLSPFTILLVFFSQNIVFVSKIFYVCDNWNCTALFICMAEVPLWCWIRICKVIWKTIGGFSEQSVKQLLREAWRAVCTTHSKLHRQCIAATLQKNKRIVSTIMKCSIETLTVCEQAF